MYSWNFYVPIVRLRPLSSFLQRYKLKIWKICFRLVHNFLLPIFGLKGATDIGLDEEVWLDKTSRSFDVVARW